MLRLLLERQRDVLLPPLLQAFQDLVWRWSRPFLILEFDAPFDAVFARLRLPVLLNCFGDVKLIAFTSA